MLGPSWTQYGFMITSTVDALVPDVGEVRIHCSLLLSYLYLVSFVLSGTSSQNVAFLSAFVAEWWYWIVSLGVTWLFASPTDEFCLISC